MGALQNLRDELTGVVALVVLGVGLADIWFPWLVPGIPFWVVFVIGFAVVLPLVAIAVGETDEATADVEPDPGRTDEAAPLDRLKRRYAEGELTDEEFERRLERLLETEDESAAADYLRRSRRGREDRPPEREEA
jgi:uncharacterized membrane protein